MRLTLFCIRDVGEVYNIGGNNEKTNVEVVEQIITLLGKTKKTLNMLQIV